MANIYLTGFNNQFIEFIDDIKVCFKDNRDVMIAYSILKKMRNANPKIIINLWKKKVFKYKEQIEDVVKDMCNKDHHVGMKHMSDECVFVRPTGNPLTKKGWDEMMNNDDVSVTSSELLKINRLSVVGNSAHVCYTSHSKFNYKGTDPLIVSGDEEISIKDLVEILVDKFKFKGKVKFDKTKPDGQLRKPSDNSAIKKLMPDFKYTPFEQGIEETVSWFVENYENARK